MHALKSKYKSTTPVVLFLLGIYAIIAISCTPKEPTPTPTPVPLVINASTQWSDLLKQIPDSESNCLKSNLSVGIYEALLDADLTNPKTYSTVLETGCLNTTTTSSLVIQSLDFQAGGLSTETKQCLAGIFSRIPADDLILLTIEQNSFELSDISAALGNALGLLLCLSDSDAEKLTTRSLLGADIRELSFAELRCTLEYVEVSEFTNFLNSDRKITTISDELKSAFEKCGINLAKT